MVALSVVFVLLLDTLEIKSVAFGGLRNLRLAGLRVTAAAASNTTSTDVARHQQ